MYNEYRYIHVYTVLPRGCMCTHCAVGECQWWVCEEVEGGERVCSTRLASWTQPATDDCSTARDDCKADLHRLNFLNHISLLTYCKKLTFQQ